jgi:peptidoglycan/xylan/chitin deacetylase (PgdA/CDA1 family)
MALTMPDSLKKPHSRFRLLTLAALVVFVFSQTGCEKLKGFLPKPHANKPAVAATPTPAAEPEEDKSHETPESAAMFGPEKKKAEDPNAPQAPAFELNKSSLVSILLYHDFVERIPRTEMMVTVPTFRAQMQTLKDENIPVIPMSDLIAWKKGEKNIPDECVIITLDDGWVGQHQFAYPILKEFGYPFTIYLYKKYVNIGGRSMTIEQIKDMLANGAELGSHTISHQQLTKKGSRTDEQYKEWLHEEIYDSKTWLEQTFGVPCRTFAYPFGAKNDEVVDMTMAAGYDLAVTTNPIKVTWDSPNGKLGRFTQLFDKDANFKSATNFHGRMETGDSKTLKADATDESGKKLIELSPGPNSEISDRLPVISANLSGIGGVVPESLMLRVSGFGAVPVEFDAGTQTASYQVQQKLRMDECTAVLGFKRSGGDKEEIVTWKFKVNQKAIYDSTIAADAPPVAAAPGPVAPGTGAALSDNPPPSAVPVTAPPPPATPVHKKPKSGAKKKQS